MTDDHDRKPSPSASENLKKAIELTFADGPIFVPWYNLPNGPRGGFLLPGEHPLQRGRAKP